MSENLNINGVEYAPALGTSKKDNLTFCIARCTGAGVHCGWADYEKFKQHDNVAHVAELFEARRMWRWHGRTLSGVAIEGSDDITRCKFGDVLSSIILTGVHELIPCTDIARNVLMGIKKWENQ